MSERYLIPRQSPGGRRPSRHTHRRRLMRVFGTQIRNRVAHMEVPPARDLLWGSCEPITNGER
jgi:hypothetical protein